MSKPKVLVTSVDGWTGHKITEHLISDLKGKLDKIYATAEAGAESAVPNPAELEKAGVTLFKLDSSKKSGEMVNAFKNADIVVLIPPTKKDKIHRSKNMIEACKEAGLKKIILISMAAADLTDEQKQPHLAEFKKIELEANQAGFDHLLIMRVNFYFENLLIYKKQILDGKLPLPIKDGKLAPISIKDTAEAVGVLVSNPDKFKEYSGQLITLTGSKAINGQEIAEDISKCIKHELKFEDISNEDAQKILTDFKNLDESEHHVLLEYYDLTKAHRAAFVTAHIFKNLVGHNPASLGEFCKIHEEHLKA
ncbi:6412_t:CDS:2 [Ambispora gerdemannii]|uniref:6412_t:CDS:1 n=1 Tax=Ambispora gerdemannii TaxID=144530 RepID=A0A9N9FSP1_9GLOM|nr:6412_t:CDS:2 [Ambispora gerdemannii]